MTQPRYQTVGHDSIQYHFFCEGLVFAARVFRTNTLEHHSAWIFEGGQVREILHALTALTQSPSDHLDITCPAFGIWADGSQGALRVDAGVRDDRFAVAFTVRHRYRWVYDAAIAGEDVDHQPDLDCVVTYRGRALRGIGYHKRYFWHRPPTHWGYRFLHGVTDDGSKVVWTADAIFGTSKYDYFKVLDRVTGSLLQSDPEHSAHKQNCIFAFISGERHETIFHEAGAWNVFLRSSAMDSHLQQRSGTFEYRVGDQTWRGQALTESCFGSLG